MRWFVNSYGQNGSGNYSSGFTARFSQITILTSLTIAIEPNWNLSILSLFGSEKAIELYCLLHSNRGSMWLNANGVWWKQKVNSPVLRVMDKAAFTVVLCQNLCHFERNLYHVIFQWMCFIFYTSFLLLVKQIENTWSLSYVCWRINIYQLPLNNIYTPSFLEKNSQNM